MQQIFSIAVSLSLTAAIMSACSSNSFSGSSGTAAPATPKTPSSNGQAVATPIPLPSATPIPTILPQNAVTQGSFTVWAEPPNPAPGQNYSINVAVKLPSNTYSYTKADLSGTLVGTDGYQQAIIPVTAVGIAPQTFTFTPANPSIPGSTPSALLVMHIPGAMKNVRDTLTVTSVTLQESQTIGIIFQ